MIDKDDIWNVYSMRKAREIRLGGGLSAGKVIRIFRVGHLDDTRSHEQILKSIQDLRRFKPPEIGKLLTVDTSREIKLAVLARRISGALEQGT